MPHGANWKVIRGEDGKRKIMRLKSKSLVFPIGAFKEDSEAGFGDSRHGTLQMNCILDVLHRRGEDFQMGGSTQSAGACDRAWAMSWKSAFRDDDF